MENAKEMLDSHLEASRHFFQRHQKTYRKQYMNVFNRISKAAEGMAKVNGKSLQKSMSKLLAEKQYALGIDNNNDAVFFELEDFAMDIDVSLKDGLALRSKNMGLAGTIDVCVAEHEPKIAAKRGKAELHLAKNTSTLGCMQKVSIDAPLSFSAFEECTDVQTHTQGPYLITGRKLAYRSSPVAVAAPGVGSAIRALSGPWLVIVVSIAKMLDEGIVLANFDKFVEKEEGNAWCREHCHAFRLDVGMTLFVPWGYIFQPMFIPEDAALDVGHLLQFTLLSLSLVADVPTNVLNQIFTSCADGWARKKGDDIFKNLDAHLKTFKQLVDDKVAQTKAPQ